MDSITIGGRRVGRDSPTYIIAEISANHNNDFEQAAELVRKAKDCGADAVKLQTYKPDTLTIKSDREPFQIGGGTRWDGRSLYDLYEEAFMPWEWQPKLKRIADDADMDLFSTAYDISSMRFLEKMGVDVHKIASFEIVDLALVEAVAGTGKPLIISTGMASRLEISDAIACAKHAGADQIALLKCTSAYPAPVEVTNLKTIQNMKKRFNLPVGLSDHTLGIHVSVAAVALGACIVEKHITASRRVKGPDSHFSLQPREFRRMVDAIRTVEKSIGDVKYGPTEAERNSLVFRRSLFAVKKIRAGERFTNQNVRSIRPGMGLPPKSMKDVLGKKASCDIDKGTPLDWSMME